MAIIEWLENPQNFCIMTGGKDNKPGEAKTKSTGYQILADYINNKRVAPSFWTRQMAESRYRSLIANYKETKKDLTDHTGEKFCISASDISKGVTLEKKIDLKCPGFRKLDALYGGRENVSPSFRMETGINYEETFEEVSLSFFNY